MYVIVSIKKTYNSRGGGASVAVCSDLPGKEPHRQVGVGSMVTSGSLGSLMVSTLAQNARGVGSIPTLGPIFHIFITATSYEASTRSSTLTPPESSVAGVIYWFNLWSPVASPVATLTVPMKIIYKAIYSLKPIIIGPTSMQGSHSQGNIIFQDISRTKLPFSRKRYIRLKGNKL